MRVGGEETVQLNASEKASPDSSLPAMFSRATDDGKSIYFKSEEQLTDAPGAGLYLYDATKPDTDPHNLKLVLEGQGGVIDASDDGAYVYLYAAEQQGLPGEPPLGGSGNHGLYLLHAGQLRFIGSVPQKDTSGMAIDEDTYLHYDDRWSRVSPDGRIFTFMATDGSGLSGYDHHGENCDIAHTGQEGCTEVYVYDAEGDGGSGELRCASCNLSGAAATAPAIYSRPFSVGLIPYDSHRARALSDDGRRVFFNTRERLLPEDRNGTFQDVYQYDVPTHELHLISPGLGTSDAYLMDASASGEDVFIATREQLVGSDVDGAVDLYDVRVNGGFPEPAPAPVCEGDSCLVAPSVPDHPTPASSSFRGFGNAAPARAKKRCAKGSRRVRRKGKARCVKSKKANRAKHDRRKSR
jgi:hypothetical protein